MFKSNDNLRDYYESSFKNIKTKGEVVGYTNLVIRSTTCKDRMIVEAIPICLINNNEVKILNQNSGIKKVCEFSKDRC